MKAKMARFNEIWHELGIPYSDPEGGYFVMANLNKVKLPEGYPFPPHRSKPSTGFQAGLVPNPGVWRCRHPPTEFYTAENASIAEDYLRFAVCKPDDILETAKERLRGLKKYIEN